MGCGFGSRWNSDVGGWCWCWSGAVGVGRRVVGGGRICMRRVVTRGVVMRLRWWMCCGVAAIWCFVLLSCALWTRDEEGGESVSL